MVTMTAYDPIALKHELLAGVGEMLADFHARYADPVTGEAGLSVT